MEILLSKSALFRAVIRKEYHLQPAIDRLNDIKSASPGAYPAIGLSSKGRWSTLGVSHAEARKDFA